MSKWFSPAEIKFWPEHIEFLLTHLNMIEEGRWPNEHRESGYTDTPGHRQKHEAYFAALVVIAAELNYRLSKCTDGKLARKCYTDGRDVKELAEIMKVSEERLQKRIDRVVKFCSGWRRKRWRNV